MKVLSALSVLTVVVSVSSCAANQRVRATQQTAVGGGFVAVGAVAASSVVVGGVGTGIVAASAGSDVGVIGPAVVVPLLVGGAFSAGVIIAGFAMMNAAEEDLLAPPVRVDVDVQRGRPTASSSTTKQKQQPSKHVPLDDQVRAAQDEQERERDEEAEAAEDRDNPRAPSPVGDDADPWQVRRHDDDPANRRSIVPVSDKLALGAGRASVILLHKGLTLGTCTSVTLRTAGEHAVALKPFAPIANAVRVALTASPLRCEEGAAVVDVCGAVVEFSRRECDALQYMLDR